MVFVMWESRQQPVAKRYGKPSFRTMGEAMLEPKGWETIAQKPDWGRFKFGHTDPNLSNSGLLTLVLMAYEFSKKEHNLSHVDVAQPEFQRWLHAFEKASCPTWGVADFEYRHLDAGNGPSRTVAIRLPAHL